MMSEPKLLDLRGVACPMNFVKTKLFLDKMAEGEQVCVLLDQGEPVESVSESVVADGHQLLESLAQEGGHYRLLIQKATV